MFVFDQCIDNNDDNYEDLEVDESYEEEEKMMSIFLNVLFNFNFRCCSRQCIFMMKWIDLVAITARGTVGYHSSYLFLMIIFNTREESDKFISISILIC